MFIRRDKRTRDGGGEHLTDREIIRRYRNDPDPEWIGMLFERYIHLVFGVCLKYLKNEEEAKDAVMEVFEKLMSDLQRHRVENFKAWLYTLTKNSCLMQLRKIKITERFREEVQITGHPFMEFVEEMHLFNRSGLEHPEEKLSGAIAQLSEEQARCIELMYLRQKSYQEITGLTGYSLKQVKSYIQNGKRNLKKLLRESHE